MRLHIDPISGFDPFDWRNAPAGMCFIGDAVSTVTSGIGSILGSGIGGAAASYGLSQEAVKQLQDAAQKSTDVQQGFYNTTSNNLSPYLGVGSQGANQLSSQLSDLTKPIVMDQATLENTPGYQFTLNQGLQSVQNGYAARGLGSSGAAEMGAANYATGLASNTYQQQFNNAVTNQQNAFKNLLGVSTLGSTTGTNLGNIGEATGSSIGNNIVGAASAGASALMGTANNISNLSNMYAAGNVLSNMYGSSGGSGGGGGGSGIGGLSSLLSLAAL